MTENNPPHWLAWAREIQALCQTGLHFAENDYQRGRYRRMMEIAAEMICDQTDLHPGTLQALFLQQVGYATPRVDVRGVVFRDGKLLMVLERADGGWTLPGGWADVGDVPSKAAEREVWEEAGFQVAARKVLGVYDANRAGPLEIFHAFKIVFLCDLISGEACPSNETSDVAFFGPDEIPGNLSNQRTPRRLIADAFAELRDPGRPTLFD